MSDEKVVLRDGFMVTAELTENAIKFLEDNGYEVISLKELKQEIVREVKKQINRGCL